MTPTRTARAASVVCCMLSLFAVPRDAAAQGLVPAKGEGNVSVTYQTVLAEGHLGPDGRKPSTPAGHDRFRSHVMMSDVQYGLTNRLALGVSLPFIATRYTGDVPHRIGVHGTPSTVDDGTYHGLFQDFRFGARYNLRTSPVAIAPFVEAIIPSHHYESRGHAVAGQDLRSLVVGASVARTLDPISPRTYVLAQLSHAFVQKVERIRANRSRVDVEVGHALTRRVMLTFTEHLKLTHDGVDFPYANLTPELARHHDRLSRNNTLHLGGGVTFALSESLDAFGSMSKLVWGANVHDHWGYGFGLNWHFQTLPALWEPRK